MNLDETERLRGPLQFLIDSSSRINANKPQQYWYPLSLATYDVEEVLAAVDSLCSFRTTMWDKTREFEARFATDTQGAGEAIMVNSGSSADLLIAFAAVNPAIALLSPGDEVLVPAVTWPTQLWSLLMAGLRIRFVDCDPNTFNMDLADLEAKVTPRTRAISLVHLMGNPNGMEWNGMEWNGMEWNGMEWNGMEWKSGVDRILEICGRHDLALLEDCCESLCANWNGKPVGSFGFAGSFSFFFSHHITTMEGGMITTRDPEVADVFRLLRAHGWARNLQHTDLKATTSDPRYTFLNWGFNVRPTELQAGFGLVQLDRLPIFQTFRQANANRFLSGMARHSDVIHLMQVEAGGDCSWFALPMLVSPGAPFTRDELVGRLELEGVETRPIVAGNLLRHPVAAMFEDMQDVHLPVADRIHENGFYVGVHPVESAANIDRLLEIFDRFIGEY